MSCTVPTTLAVRPGALEIRKPMHLNPADFAVCALEPELDRVGLRIDGIACRLAGRPKPFCIVRMQPFLDLLDRRLISSNVENFLRAGIP
jgi:hypothetical protein